MSGPGEARTPRRPVDRDDLFRIRWVGEPAISPDGRHVAYVVAGLDPHGDEAIRELRWLDLESGTDRPSGPPGAREHMPRWSPDGRRLAFISDRTGSPAAWILEVGTGAIRAAGSAAGDVRSLDWAPDGRHLVAVVEPPGEAVPTSLPFAVRTLRARRDGGGLRPSASRLELWVLPAVDGDAVEGVRISSDGGASDWAASWSPDGAAIAFLSDDGVDPDLTTRTGLWLIAPDGSARRRLVEPTGPIRALAWAPHGTEIALIGHERGDDQGENNELWVVRADGRGRAVQLGAELDRSVGQAVRGEDARGLGPPDLAWTPDGSGVLAIVADGGLSQLRRFDRAGGTRVLVGGERSVLQFASARDSGDLAFAASDPSTPGELAIARPDGGGERRITSVNDAWLGEIALAPCRPIRVRTDDGATIEAWLTGPGTERSAGPLPLILQVHGGPHYPVGWRFSLDAQVLAAGGYQVVTANPRGSQGYGAAFATAIRGDWGGRDLADLLAVVDKVVALGETDPERIAIVGESYGGYMALWAIARTDRFRAAVAENGIADLTSVAGDASGSSFWRSELGGLPWEVPQRYLDRSPLTHVTGITAPVLLVHAELDGNCPIDQSMQMHAALRSLGREVEFVVIPGEGHFVNVFGRPSRRRARHDIIDRFLSRHLHPGAEIAP